jgi:hypothetical protein
LTIFEVFKLAEIKVIKYDIIVNLNATKLNKIFEIQFINQKITNIKNIFTLSFFDVLSS